MSNSLAVIDRGEFDTMQRVSKALVASGYFNDAKDMSQALVKVMAGREMGLGPFASMTGVHIIKGKPVLGANLIATLIKAHPDYNYRIKAHTNEICEIEFFEHGESVGVSSFAASDAKAAGLSGDNWRKYARNMLFARAISNGAKWHTPGIFGGAPVYTPDELGADVQYDGNGDETGEYIESPISAVMQPDEARLSARDDYEQHISPGDVRGVTSPEAQAKRERPSAPHRGDNLTKQFHAVGTEAYGKEWDTKRGELVGALGKESSKDLTPDEKQRLIDGMKAKVN